MKISGDIAQLHIAELQSFDIRFPTSLTLAGSDAVLGPEKGVVHLATAAIINALWDLWGKLEKKPLWKLISDMTPEEIVSLIDFRYITDVLTKNEALEILRSCQHDKTEREGLILEHGVPAYVTSVGWMGYDDAKIERLCKESLAEGWESFKMKVGVNVGDDQRRARIIRAVIGPDRKLMMDANQVWEVSEAIHWMEQLTEFKPHWIEEPTSPDDVSGHGVIAQAMNKFGIGVATGEHCQNRVMFKQFIAGGGMQFCQIDACRLGGVNEVLSVLLLAAKYNIPVCPHAGGVGLCELVQHLAIINYLCIKPTFQNTMVEFADHLHEHFVSPVKVANGRYLAPLDPGYSCELKKDSLDSHIYPTGTVWKRLIASKQHSPV